MANPAITGRANCEGGCDDNCTCSAFKLSILDWVKLKLMIVAMIDGEEKSKHKNPKTVKNAAKNRKEYKLLDLSFLEGGNFTFKTEHWSCLIPQSKIYLQLRCCLKNSHQFNITKRRAGKGAKKDHWQLPLEQNPSQEQFKPSEWQEATNRESEKNIANDKMAHFLEQRWCM